jgi:hypothetical protein
MYHHHGIDTIVGIVKHGTTECRWHVPSVPAIHAWKFHVQMGFQIPIEISPMVVRQHAMKVATYVTNMTHQSVFKKIAIMENTCRALISRVRLHVKIVLQENMEMVYNV